MNESKKLKRGLKSRHVTMIAIGGAIGTGLFLGSGSAIHSAGPSIILSYLIVGIITFFMMRALGELILADPDSHSFLESIKKYLGKCAEFLAGWTYWACWLSLAMADLSATGIYLRYWFPWLPQWVGSLVIVVLFVVVILNYVMPARIFDVVSTVSTICFVIVWIMIMAAHVVYRRQNKDNLGEFRMPGYPLTSWLTIAFYVAILILLFFIESTKLALIISIIFIVILATSYSFIKKNESVS